MEKLGNCKNCGADIYPEDLIKNRLDKIIENKKIEIEKQNTTEFNLKLKDAINKEEKKYQLQRKEDKATDSKTIERLGKKVQEMKSHMDQRLPTDQGSAQEEILGKQLKEDFPEDNIYPFAKGESGGDWIQEVRFEDLTVGKILYESKKTKSFASKWLPKLRDDMDMKNVNADIGIIFTQTLPPDFKRNQLFKEKNNILICKKDYILLSIIVKGLRENLIRNSKNDNKNDSNALSAFEFLKDPKFNNKINIMTLQLEVDEKIEIKMSEELSKLQKSNDKKRENFKEFFDLIKTNTGAIFKLKKKGEK